MFKQHHKQICSGGSTCLTLPVYAPVTYYRGHTSRGHLLVAYSSEASIETSEIFSGGTTCLTLLSNDYLLSNNRVYIYVSIYVYIYIYIYMFRHNMYTHVFFRSGESCSKFN